MTTPQTRPAITNQPHYELRLPSHVATELGRYLTPIVEKIDTAHTENPDTITNLVIDLSDATTVPTVQLTLLITLLRRTLGPEPTITLTGLRPPLLASLVAFDLPPGTIAVDSRGRTWRR